jgi:hypothetical protein
VSQRAVVLDLSSESPLARDLVAGGVFVPGEVLGMNEECLLVLRNGDAKLEVRAVCVWVNGTQGSGLQLVGCDAEMKQQIVMLASGMQLAPLHLDLDPDTVRTSRSEDTPPPDEPLELDLPDEQPTDENDETDEERKIALNVNERLRGLSLAQQIKIAKQGEVSERIILERMYGKNVWDALLRNPRITGPEVARIARMGALPRTLVEIIVSNGAWLQIPEVRRALLTNPRLGTDQILRVLRLLPKHELKLAAAQTAYPFAVRDAAKRMLKESGGG